MQQRAKRLRAFSEAIAARRWKACPKSLYCFIYGLPPSVLLPMAAEQIARMMPVFEKRWPSVMWPREIVESTKRWIGEFGRSIPDLPERNSVAEARFIFSLDALLLGSSYPENVSVLTSSCACALREIVDIGVQLSAEEGGFEEELREECERCDAASKQKPHNPESRIEFARSREWQTVLDAVLIRNLEDYPATESPAQLEADLAAWEDHEELLIVPDAALVLTR